MPASGVLVQPPTEERPAALASCCAGYSLAGSCTFGEPTGGLVLSHLPDPSPAVVDGRQLYPLGQACAFVRVPPHAISEGATMRHSPCPGSRFRPLSGETEDVLSHSGTRISRTKYIGQMGRSSGHVNDFAYASLAVIATASFHPLWQQPTRSTPTQSPSFLQLRR